MANPDQAAAVPPVTIPPMSDAELDKKTDEITQKVVAKIAAGVKQRISAALDEPAPAPSEVEVLLDTNKVSNEDKDGLRKELEGLPAQAQSIWLRSYLDAQVYAATQDDLKGKPREYAGRIAWASVKQRFQKAGEMWRDKKASIGFNSATGKWVVDHRTLLMPIITANKADAETLLKLIADSQKPEVKAEGDTISVTHPDWAEPVITASAEEATDVVTKKLVDEGWSDTEAITTAKELVEATQKEKIMGSIEVKAGTKQNQQKGEVSGIQSDAGASSPKNQPPTIGGKVSMESHDQTVVPAAKKHAFAVKTDYEADAKKLDTLVNQLNSHKGLMKMTAALIEKHGAEVVEQEFKALEEKLDKATEVVATPETK